VSPRALSITARPSRAKADWQLTVLKRFYSHPIALQLITIAEKKERRQERKTLRAAYSVRVRIHEGRRGGRRNDDSDGPRLFRARRNSFPFIRSPVIALAPSIRALIK
jgi:hypothetical protein